MIGFPLVIANSKQDMPGIKLGPLGWYTIALTTELLEVITSNNVKNFIHLKVIHKALFVII